MSDSAPSNAVTIVTACFNDGAYLRESVRSTLAQTHPDLEVIVVDDGSTDHATLGVLDEVEALGVRVIHQENQGLPGARNTGIAAARGAYILPVDADDIVEPEYAALAAAELDARPELGIVYPRADLFGAITGPWELGQFDVGIMLTGNQIPACSMFRKEDWAAVGGYHQVRLEDHDLWLSILELGRTAYRLDRVLYHYRQRSDSITGAMAEEDTVRALAEVIRAHPQYYLDNIEQLIRIRRAQWNTLQHWKQRYGFIEDRLHQAAPLAKRLLRRT
ncbi:glycosyltransferase family A protein [Allobranchiibius sp. CTAmp26]|uniref:glycosyltransferase family A protein n=1 Tax=Allobranchiibius sp. CTAmp26 TaxID=2815214 RepID=UPI001AA11132|nr:glycosyltransferase family A protein [Allobranchiibius sp. CTAmp26]MBO1756217.1 glycosyltransferase family 2 protein [Allobranchiibius sp. CTAmp26]